METATIYRRNGEWLKQNVPAFDAIEEAARFVAILNQPVLAVVGDRCWEVGDGGNAEELDEWEVDAN